MLAIHLKPGRRVHLVLADGRTVTIHGDQKVAARVGVEAPADVKILRDDHVADGRTPAEVAAEWRAKPKRRAA